MSRKILISYLNTRITLSLNPREGVLPSQPYTAIAVGADPLLYKRLLGNKAYELKDHLGNIRATLSDIKLSDLNASYQPGNYRPDLLTANNYYPFGMQQPGRVYNSGKYRYGFNGKEMDNDVKGTGVVYDYGFRIYDARIAKFLSVDPLTNKYPELTPYQFASNSPIEGIDLDGLEKITYLYYSGKNGIPMLTNIYKQDYDKNGRKLPFTREVKWGIEGNECNWHDYSFEKAYNFKTTTKTGRALRNAIKYDGLDGSSGNGKYYGKTGFKRLGEDLSESSTYVKAGGIAVAGISAIAGQPEGVVAGMYIYKVGDIMDKTSSGMKIINAASEGDTKSVITESAGIAADVVVGRGADKIKDPVNKMVREVAGDKAVEAVKDNTEKKEEK
jgi:RHS repeat-associated protein